MARRIATILLLLLCLGSIAPAEEQAPQAVDEIADAIIAAHAEGKALGELAKTKQSPWFVLDALIDRNATSAAQAFAELGPEPERVALVRLARAGPKASNHHARRRAVQRAFAALKEKKPQEALSALEPTAGEAYRDMEDVPACMAERARGSALLALGKREEAIAVLVEAMRLASRVGWRQGAVEAGFLAGIAAKQGGLFPRAADVWREVIDLESKRGHERILGSAWFNLALCLRSLGRLAETDEAYEKATGHYEAAGDKGQAARTGIFHANVVSALGEATRAIEIYEQTITRYRALNDQRMIVYPLVNVAHLHRERFRHQLARERFEEALPLARANLPQMLPTALAGLAQVLGALGEPAEGLRLYQEALKLAQAGKQREIEAATWQGIGRVQSLLGRFPEALRAYEKAIAQARKLPPGPPVLATLATALINKGTLESNLGHPEQARPLYEEALEVARRAGSRHEELSALKAMGALLGEAGNTGAAIARFEEVVRIAAEHDLPWDEATAAMNIGVAHLAKTDGKQAKAWFERARKAAETIGDIQFRVQVLSNLALSGTLLGEWDEARSHARAATEAAEGAQLGLERVAALKTLADIERQTKRWEAALESVYEAIAVLRQTMRTLPDESAARAKESHHRLFEIGYEAAAALADAPALFRVMEESRGVSLLAGIESGETLRAAVLPENLRRLDAEARAAEARARKGMVLARRRGRLPAMRKATLALQRAEAHVDEVVRQIQRESRVAAAVVYPTVTDLPNLQGALAAGEVFVAYGLSLSRAYALVLTADTARIVPLVSTARIRAHLERLRAEDGREMDIDALDALGAALVAPLGLTDDRRRLLICPAPELGFVPFSALLPEHPVALLPSGTLHVTLRDARTAAGKRVLALGDPVYANTARLLTRLPGTRSEVEGVGDVKLLGQQASVAALWKALAQEEQWRALHLACHGIVDHEHPNRSHLALADDPAGNHSLFAIDILQRKVPADLVVLSACDSARGRAFKAEGVVGLTRAFFLAGAPRVVSSLWKVDDEATRALMLRFYELWNPKEGQGVSAAEALQQAQTYVRNQEAWKHPYFWSAWTLSGLPD